MYMDCTTAVSNAGKISWIERSMGSLPGSSAIAPVIVVAMPCLLDVVVGPGPHWASRAAVSTQSSTLMLTSGVGVLAVGA